MATWCGSYQPTWMGRDAPFHVAPSITTIATARSHNVHSCTALHCRFTQQRNLCCRFKTYTAERRAVIMRMLGCMTNCCRTASAQAPGNRPEHGQQLAMVLAPRQHPPRPVCVRGRVTWVRARQHPPCPQSAARSASPPCSRRARPMASTLQRRAAERACHVSKKRANACS